MISSSKLWHYTSFDNLKLILKCEYLRPSNSSCERYDFISPNISLDYKKVCLTNLSTDDNRIHKSKYGECYIGFNNSWVDDKQICPIIYCRRNGKLTKLLQRIIQDISDADRNELLQYIKPYSDYKTDPYEGPNGGMEELRRYDEREWRYISQFEDDVLDFEMDDIYRIYVPTDRNMNDLKAEFPAYASKIYSLGRAHDDNAI